MKLHWTDRVVAQFDPVRAAARTKARMQLDAVRSLPSIDAASAGGYTSVNGSDSWFSRWSTSPRSAAADTLRQLPDLRGQSRDLVRNNAVAASAINTNVVRAVGTGLAYSAQPHAATLGWSPEQAAAWAIETQAEFSMFADSRECDLLGEQNFYEKQDLTLRSMLESGDVFSLLPDGDPTPSMPYRLRIQTLEADRIGNPGNSADCADYAAGVRRSAAGPVDSYHVYRQHPGNAIRNGDVFAGDWVKAVGQSGRRRMLHHFKYLRPEAPRGVPYLAPVMGLFKLLGTYTDAEVKAAVVSAFLTVFIQTEHGLPASPIYTGPQASASASQDIELGPAAVVGLARGETANAVTPGRPNPAFGDFVQAVFDQLGAGLFIGPEMLLKKFNTSYVAARAAFLDAWRHLLDMRTLMARSFCQPILETWMAEAVANGRVRAPGFFTDPRLRWAYTRAAWHGDSQGSINPKDEVDAYLKAIDGRILTRERAQWELFGTDWRDTYATQLAEHTQLKADGMLPQPKPGAAAPVPDAVPTNPGGQP